MPGSRDVRSCDGGSRKNQAFSTPLTTITITAGNSRYSPAPCPAATMTPLASVSAIASMLGPPRLKMRTSRWSSSVRLRLTVPLAISTKLASAPVAMSSAPSTQSGWRGVSSTAAMSSGVMNSTSVCPALARRPV